jgi:2-dehydropantoate 2-reductase
MGQENRWESGPRNIWIYGVGGVGGYFGGKIAHAIEHMGLSEKRVFFIARGRHLEEIQKNGLTLNTSDRSGIICRPERATDTIDGLPAPDLCLVCVKSYDLPDVVQALTPKINDETVVMPLLNGVDICERIRDILDKGIVLPACVYVGTHIDKPGVVSQKGGDGIILCGADPQRPGFAPGTLIAFFGEVGIRFEWRDDPRKAIWEKYLFIASFGLVTVLSGKTLGGVFADDSLRALVRGIMNEIVSIAKKKGIDLAEDVVAVSLARAGNFPFDAKTSFQRDVETRGGRNEGDLFGGTIIKMGGALGVETPITRSVYERIRKLRLE